MAEPTNARPLAEPSTRVGDRWTLLVVEALLDGPRRFGDLEEELAGIAPNILTQRLRRLESEGLVVAQPYSRAAAALRLRADRAGRELAGALRLLADWGARHREAPSRLGTTPAARRSRRAGGARRASGPVDEDEAGGLHFA